MGDLDPFYYYFMDWDFWLKAGARHRIDYIPELLSTYRLHSESKTVAQSAKAAPELERMYTNYFALGYVPGVQTFDPLQNVNLAMHHHASMPDIEVIWPGHGPSPIDQMIKRGNMIYHMCFETDDAAASVVAMEADGLRVFSLGEPKPARLFGGVPVSFHRVDQVGLIELIHGVPRPMQA